MGLVNKAILVLGISLASVTLASAEPADRGASGRATSEQAVPAEQRHDAAQSERPSGDIPVYVPPTDRGSIPLRVGGASRGGQLPGKRL